MLWCVGLKFHLVLTISSIHTEHTHPCFHLLVWGLERRTTRSRIVGRKKKQKLIISSDVKIIECGLILTERLVDKEVSLHSTVLDWPGHTKGIRGSTNYEILCCVKFNNVCINGGWFLVSNHSLNQMHIVCVKDFVNALDHDILIKSRWLLWKTLKSVLDDETPDLENIKSHMVPAAPC